MRKKITIIIFLAGIAALASSCKREPKLLASTRGTSGYAYLRVVHVSPNFRAVLGFPHTFHVYINHTRITGPLFTSNSNFPLETTNVVSYVSVIAGNYH